MFSYIYIVYLVHLHLLLLVILASLFKSSTVKSKKPMLPTLNSRNWTLDFTNGCMCIYFSCLVYCLRLNQRDFMGHASLFCVTPCMCTLGEEPSMAGIPSTVGHC